MVQSQLLQLPLDKMATDRYNEIRTYVLAHVLVLRPATVGGEARRGGRRWGGGGRRGRHGPRRQGAGWRWRCRRRPARPLRAAARRRYRPLLPSPAGRRRLRGRLAAGGPPAFLRAAPRLSWR